MQFYVKLLVFLKQSLVLTLQYMCRLCTRQGIVRRRLRDNHRAQRVEQSRGHPQQQAGQGLYKKRSTRLYIYKELPLRVYSLSYPGC